jgi:glycosyltransferase involved in cell wall biosynthesis
LNRIGVKTTLLSPGQGYRGLTPRLLWNFFLTLKKGSYDWILGVDIDGVFLNPPEGTRYGVMIKGVAMDEARFESLLPKLKLITHGYLEGANIYRAKIVLLPSLYSAGCLERFFGVNKERFALLPEGIDLSRFPLSLPSRPSRSDSLHLLTVAHQYPRKNTRLLIQIFPELLRHFPTAILRVVGEGPELLRLKKLAHNLGISASVQFLGAVSEEKLLEEYRRAYLFVLPSLQEGFGIVFLEAMACGLPIVAFRRGAVPEVVPDQKAGILSEPDPPSLLSALLELLDNPSLAQRMGAYGFRYVRRFAWERIALRLVKTLRESSS